MSDLNQFLFIYEELINQIAKQKNINRRLVLKVLNCRDQIDTLLCDALSSSVLNQERLIELDQLLIENSNQLSRIVDFSKIRQSIQKSENRWWIPALSKSIFSMRSEKSY